MISHYNFVSQFYNKVIKDCFNNESLVETEHFKNNVEASFILIALITSGFNLLTLARANNSYGLLRGINDVLTNYDLTSFDRFGFDSANMHRVYVEGFGFFIPHNGWYYRYIQRLAMSFGMRNFPDHLYQFFQVYGSDKEIMQMFEPYRDKDTGSFWGVEDIHKFAKLNYQQTSPFDSTERISQAIIFLFSPENIEFKILEQLYFLRKFNVNQIPLISETTLNQIVDAFFDLLYELINEGEIVSIENFGTFEMKTTPARVGRNPKTGEKALIPEKTRINKTAYNPIPYDSDRELYKQAIVQEKPKKPRKEKRNFLSPARLVSGEIDVQPFAEFE